MPGDLPSGHRCHGDFYVAAVLQHDPRRRAGHLHLDVRRVQRGQPDRQDRRERGAGCPTNSGIRALDEDGTRLLVGLLPAHHRRRRPDAQGPARADAGPADAAGRRRRPAADPAATWRWASRAASQHVNERVFVPANAVDGEPSVLLGECQRRVPAVAPGRPRLGGDGQPGRAEAAAGLGHADADAVVQGSANGSTFSTLSASAGRVFNPASGNAVTHRLPGDIGTVRAGQRHRQHRLARGPALPVRGVRRTSGPGPDTQAPTAPANLTVSGKTATSVSLSWSASTDNVGVTGYQVRRAGAVVATVTGLSATVGGLSPATAYSFTVTAKDAAGNTSNPSNTVTVTTDPAPWATSPPASRHRTAATRRTTGRATSSTATHRPIGRVRTTRSRNGCRSTSAPRTPSPGLC